MGAQFACPDRTVVLVSGDGSFMMNVQELATIARCRLPVKIVLLDNSSLGMVRQWQELFFAERYSEIDLSDNPDFVALAQVFGIAATRIDNRDDVEGGLAALLAEPARPCCTWPSMHAPTCGRWCRRTPPTARCWKATPPMPARRPQCNTGLTWCCTRPKARCCA